MTDPMSIGTHRELRARIANLSALVNALAVDVTGLAARVAALERSCQNDPPGGQGGSTFDPPGPAEGPVRPCSSTEKIPKKISGEE